MGQQIMDMDNMQILLNNSNVLIIDDSYYNVKILTAMFEQKEYCVRNAYSYELGLKSVRENIPDIILLKVNIGNIYGYEICGRLKASYKLQKIPVIFIIDENETINKDKIFAAGASDYITVPFNYKEVTTRVDNQLKIREIQLEMKENNDDLKKQVYEGKRQLEDITEELKEFNITLEEEITERTKTEEALRESERKFRYSIEEAPVPVMLYTQDGEVLKINRTWSYITGYTIDDIPTTSKLAEISDVFKEDIYKLSNFSEKQNSGEYSVKTKHGNIRIWDFYLACIGKLTDKRNMLIAVAVDVTEKRCMEQLQKNIEKERIRLSEIKKYDRMKTDFFANISHELRTPINLIFSAIQVYKLKLKECICENSCSDRYKYIKIMEQNCYRLLRLVNNLIDITKIDSGYFNIDEVNYNIVSLVEDTTLSIADYIKSKGLSIVFDTDVEEKIIACDPEEIERILLNLLSNAIKFTPRGGNIMVNVEDGNKSISIKVKDTGKGIPKEKLNSIFERFVQVDKSLARENEGSGIGLSLVKALVELHGGTISVKSKEGYGSEFIIHIPCKLVDGKTSSKNEYGLRKNYIEKINLEFSDIYN
ncbi:Sensor histidine kinase TmoS [Clostridium ljungdahlii DSM 13528]|uniref:Stage 0 sporulation protein A homolog n=2 Tax=Clostridium ljungdahlii TaxID=1538 RepID=D8GIW3_CLOLD|nr:predicted sensory transduction histidine kinase [Clostridium ljungdahlii DSM 13528]OAA87699.1 Sensor histidine kinase TmoS [Clostridium ljungdahlii DSM 13528]